MSELPDDMDATTKAHLIADRYAFGTCYYEETPDGYKRHNPLQVANE